MGDSYSAQRIAYEASTKAQFNAAQGNPRTTKAINVRDYRTITVLVENQQGAEVGAPSDVTVEVLVKLGSGTWTPLKDYSTGAATANKVFTYTLAGAFGEIQVRVTAGATKPEFVGIQINGGGQRE